MARTRIPKIYDLAFDGDLEGLHVRIRSVKFGKVRQIIALLDDDSKELEAFELIASLLAENIVSWDFEDEQGAPIPVNRETIDDLEFQEIMAIVNKWLDLITGPSDELGKGSSSGETFPGRPLTMEAL